MPLRISSLMTSAVLIPSASARSLTATEEGISTGPVALAGAAAAAASASAAADGAVRRRWGRGGRRGRYLRGGMQLHLEVERSRLDIGIECSLDRSRE